MSSFGRRHQERAAQVVCRAALFLLLVGVWEFLARSGVLNAFYSSQPSRILLDFPDFYISGNLFKHTAVTLSEALWGLLCGTLAGIAAAFLLGMFDFLGKVIEPFITALYGIPKLALAPIFVLWFGLGIESKVIMSGLLVFFLVFFSTYGGIKSVDRNILTSVRLMGATRMQFIFKVVLPSCVPWILAGVRGGLGASLIGAIVGEYFGGPRESLGVYILQEAQLFRFDNAWAAIIISALLGIAFYLIILAAERIAIPWHASVDRQ